MENETKEGLDNITLGKRLKECRKAKGLTQEQLVDEICKLPQNRGKNRDRQTIGRYESGKYRISYEMAELCGRVLEVLPEYLTGEKEYPTIEAEQQALDGFTKEARDWLLEHNQKREDAFLELMQNNFFHFEFVCTKTCEKLTGHKLHDILGVSPEVLEAMREAWFDDNPYLFGWVIQKVPHQDDNLTWIDDDDMKIIVEDTIEFAAKRIDYYTKQQKMRREKKIVQEDTTTNG